MYYWLLSVDRHDLLLRQCSGYASGNSCPHLDDLFGVVVRERVFILEWRDNLCLIGALALLKKMDRCLLFMN